MIPSRHRQGGPLPRAFTQETVALVATASLRLYFSIESEKRIAILPLVLPLLMCDNVATPATEPIIMNLTFDEGNRFYNLYTALLSFVNRKLEVTPEQFSNLEEYVSTPPEARLAIRDALFARRELIDEFVRDNPANLEADDLEIVGTWKHAVAGKFCVFRYLKKYTVFLTSGESPNKAYGVLGLADPLQEIVGPSLPRLITTVLLPFQGKIIYDGLVSGYNISFGGGIKRMFNEEYKQAKETFGIITSLGDDKGEEAKRPRKSKPRSRKATKASGGVSAASEAKEIAAALTKMTDAFCRDFLSEEYAELCRKLAGRPGPKTSVAASARPAGHLGQRDRTDDRMGSISSTIQASRRTCRFRLSMKRSA